MSQPDDASTFHTASRERRPGDDLDDGPESRMLDGMAAWRIVKVGAPERGFAAVHRGDA